MLSKVPCLTPRLRQKKPCRAYRTWKQVRHGFQYVEAAAFLGGTAMCPAPHAHRENDSHTGCIYWTITHPAAL